LNYLPTRWNSIPPALFGLGAIFVARNPDGVVAFHARQLEWMLSKRRRPTPTAAPAGATPEPAESAPIPAATGATTQTLGNKP
jgi:branched-chain amino acid transport system permease protein